jgi:hypothetical protein
MNNLATEITNPTTYAEIIENNIFRGGLADKLFKQFLLVYSKHKSPSVDEAIMSYVTTKVAKTCQDSFEKIVKNKNKSDMTIDGLLNNEAINQRTRLICYLIDYHNLHPDNKNSLIKSNNKTELSKSLKSHTLLGLCVSNFSEIFNWQAQTPTAKSDSNITTDNAARKRIYNSALKELKQIDALLMACENNSENSTSLACAFARYELYRHTSLHKIDRRYFRLIADLLAQHYCMSLFLNYQTLNE